MITTPNGNSLPLDPSIFAGYRHRMRGELYAPDAITVEETGCVHHQRCEEQPALVARSLSAHDVALAIALAREVQLELTEGNAYLVGKTNTGAIDTEGFQKQCVGFDNPIDDCPSDDGFVVVLNAAGNSVIGGTILGGFGSDEATGVALDSERNVYVTGTTFSNDFPTKNAWQAEKRGADNFADGFLVKLAPLAKALSYGTYYGGEGYDEAHSVAVDGTGQAYVTGLTSSDDLPVPGAFQKTITGLCLTTSNERHCYDAFIAGFDTAGSLSWASYTGGTDDDGGNGIAVGSNGGVYIAGRAESLTLPTTAGSFQPKKAGNDDAFLAWISTATTTVPEQQQQIYIPLVVR